MRVSPQKSSVVVSWLAAALLVIVGQYGVAQEQEPSPSPVHIVYFVPNDMEPVPGYQQRLDDVMTDTQDFYRREMERLGYGPITFALERDGIGNADRSVNKSPLLIHVVQGAESHETYGRNSAGIVMREVRADLKQRGIDIDRRVLMVFNPLLIWDGNKNTEFGPYCGGGSHRGGFAHAYDCKLLDPAKLNSKASGGYFHRPCSVGEHNSHYLGGIVHELGHAFGLPHVCQTRQQRETLGTALMGAGNHTYGQEQRTKWHGTFLMPTSAMLLSQCRAFVGDQPQADAPMECKVEQIDAQFADAVIRLSGKLTLNPPARGIFALNDRVDRPSDYDAVGWVGEVDDTGQFSVNIGEMVPGKKELRLIVCHEGGSRSQLTYHYHVNELLVPELSLICCQSQIESMLDFYRSRKPREAFQAAKGLYESTDNELIQRQALHMLKLLTKNKPQPLDAVDDGQDEVRLADVTCVEAKVGWARPLRNQVQPEGKDTVFLQVDGEFHESGLYAHAPSRYAWAIGADRTKFSASFGLQDGHPGSVIFVVRGKHKSGELRELFRSPLVNDRKLRNVDLDVTDVEQIELIVEPSEDGTAGDWGVWIKPTLNR